MTPLVYFLLVSVVFSGQTVTSQDNAVGSPKTIDPLMDQSVIDEPWIGYMITAPATINLLGQVMVVASTVDVSFETYSPNHRYQYIKYPKSLRATLLQIANEGYRAFLGAHSTMNKIQAYMKQIPQHMDTITKIASSKISAKLFNRLLPRSVNNIERIGNTCVALASGANHSFTSVLFLISEVLEIVTVTQGEYEADRDRNRIDLNVTTGMHADMKREEEERRKKYEEIRETVRKAQEEYSQALKDIPTGWKALALDLGRAAIKVLSAFGQSIASSKSGGVLGGGGQFAGAGKGEGQSFGSSQIINFAARFSESLDKFIQTLSKNVNQTLNPKELQGYKVLFGSYNRMLNILPSNNLKAKAVEFVQRAIKLVDVIITTPNATVIDKLEALANDVKPFMAADQLSPSNNAPIGVSSEGGDSSNNELLKARLAQERLGQQEQRLDAYYANHLAAMEKMRELTARLALLNLKEIKFTEIIKMLEEAFKLLGQLQKNWSDLVLFFSGFADQVVTGFGEKLKTFVGTAGSSFDAESSATDRKFILELLKEDSGNLYHESYVLFVLSRTYYDVSSKYLMPRLSGLSLMLASSNNAEREALLVKLKQDTEQVQNKVKDLIEERKRLFKKAVSEKRAKINEVIDEQGEDGNEDEIIEEGEKLLELQ